MAAENRSKDPEPFVGTPISARFAEVEAEAAPFMNEVMGYSKRSLVDRLVSEHRKRTQPGHTDFSRPEASSSSKAMVSVSGGARPPLHHPVDSFLRQNVHESYQASSGPIRTKKVSTKRSEPYQSSRAQPIEHRNAEASQSTPPPVQPTGKVIPETTADAETNKKNTEGDKPGRKRDKAAVRSWERQNYQQLREWVKRWKGLKSLPSRNQALHWALKYVKAVRQPVYERHRLASTPPTASKKGVLVAAQIERERRAEAHSLFEELSRYYQMAGGNGVRSRGEIRGGEQVWNCVALLSEVVRDLTVRDPLSGPSENSAP